MSNELKSPTDESYAARLKEERLRIEPSQQAFARRIGISKVRQCQLETGTRGPRADYLRAVAKLGVDINYIITGERSPSLLSRREAEVIGEFRSLGRGDQEALLLSARRMRNKISSSRALRQNAKDDVD